VVALISNERKVGLVPRLIVAGKWGPKEYAILVTDQRTILVLEKESKAGLGGALGGAAGSIIASAATKSRSFDYAQLDPQSLAGDTKNITIPHEALQGVRTKKRFIGPVYGLEFRFQTVEGKSKTVKGHLIPPGAHMKQRKQDGTSRKQIYYDYTRKAQDLYQAALSPARFQTLFTSPMQ
jgi:hypothetical protein